MAPRSELQTLLESLLGSRNVYHQAPPSTGMKYPAIVYRRDDENTQHADNRPYKTMKRWSVMVIDEDPDSAIPDKVSALPMCTFDRSYAADNLNHDVFSLFF